MTEQAATNQPAKNLGGQNHLIDQDKTKDIRSNNIIAAKGTLHSFISYLILFLAVSDVVRTSLGPRGMDKMVLHFNYFIRPLDSRWQRQSPHYQRWSHYSQANGSGAPHC
jgi:hypothetical protein